ncbi:MAG: hypothetical protein LUO79_04200 [Methanomassiliicoccales archaeon]|nr:hypothetical protein [Methanomassiliicoccales archaeon]
MAKKRRKEEVEAEKYEWKPPDFDEKSFLKTDIKGTKVLIVAVVLGLTLGVVAYALTGVSAIIGALILLIGAVLLKKLLPLFRVNIEGVKNTTIAGNAVMLFFMGLMIWIVLLNPPFSDHYPPQFSTNQVYFQHGSGNWTTYPQSPTITVGDNIRVVVKVVDNGQLSSVQVSINQGMTSGYVNMDTSIVPGSYTFQANSVPTAATYSYTVKAVDAAGNSNTVEGSFIVSA